MDVLKISNTSDILLFSDIHWGKSKDALIRLEINQQIIDWICTFKDKTNTVFFLGDWFNSRVSVNVQTFNFSYDALLKLSKSFENVVLIVGNHDIYYRESRDIHSLKSFDNIKNVKIIDNLSKVEFKNGKDGYLIPWNSINNDIIESLEPSPFSFGHLDASGIIALDDSANLNISNLNKLSPLVFSGHYHIRNEIPTRYGKIVTIGCPSQMDWGDFNNEKGVYLLNTNDSSYTYFQNDFSPKYIKYNWSGLLSKVEKINPQSITNNFVKIVLDQKYNYDHVVKLTDKINEHKPLKLSIDFSYSLSQFLNTDTDIEFKKSLNPLEYIYSFIDRFDDINVSKKTIKDVVTDYYNWAITKDESSLTSFSTSSNNIEFLNLRVQNFKSIGKHIEFDFTQHSGFNYISGLNLDVDGSNGSGKSSLFIDSILFAIYNKTIYSCKNENIPNRILNSAKKTKKKYPTYSILTFKKSDKYYRVENHLFRHLLYEIDADGNIIEDLTKSSVFETRTFLAKEILGLTYDIFRNSVILSGSSFKNIFEMSKHQKREFIEAVFNLSMFSIILVQCRKDLNTNEKEILEITSNIKLLERSIEEYKVKYNNFNNEKDKEKQQIVDKVEKKKTDILKLTLEHSEDTLKNILKIDKLAEYQEKSKDLTIAISKIENKLNSNNSSVEHRKKLKSKYQIVLDKICKDCYSLVSTELDIKNLDEFTKDIEEKNELLIDKLEKINETKKTFDLIILKLKQAKVKFDEDDKLIQHNIFVKNHLLEDIKHLDESLSVESVNPFADLIQNKTLDLEKYRGLYKEKSDYRKVLEVIEFLIGDDQNAVKATIVVDIIDLLNTLIKKYLQILGSNYSAFFGSTFDFDIVTSSGISEYNSLSAGERQKIILSTLLSFQEILENFNSLNIPLQIFDEFDQNLDPQTLGLLFEYIKSGISNKKVVYLISHKLQPELLDIFDNQIIVVKEADQTKILSDPAAGIFENLKPKE